MGNMIRILVADDHPVVRDGLIAILGTQPDFEVVAQAKNGVEVLQKSAETKPDVIMMDLEMPGMDGVTTIRQLHAAQPDVRTIVFTAYDTDERILGAIRAGALGYLLKGAPRDDIFKAVRAVSQGESLLQPVVASKLVRHVAKTLPDLERLSLEPIITPRESEVLALLAQGYSNKRIAATLFISERTVKFHVSALLRKLSASNRTEAVSHAQRLGLV
jgi:NarL family two-component system response regulator LiaR